VEDGQITNANIVSFVSAKNVNQWNIALIVMTNSVQTILICVLYAKPKMFAWIA
jgi:hypothetical protein